MILRYTNKVIDYYRLLKEVDEIIVQASLDTGPSYGVSKCAEIVFEKGKMMKEGLEVLQEKMRTLDSDEQESSKFLGVEQARGIKIKELYERVEEGKATYKIRT